MAGSPKTWKQRVLDALQRIGGDYARKQFITRRCTNVVSVKDIEARLAGDTAATATGFTDSQNLETRFTSSRRTELRVSLPNYRRTTAAS